jgi:TRAP transporter TAXI family solute receptor
MRGRFTRHGLRRIAARSIGKLAICALSLAGLAVATLASGALSAQDLRFFRIGTGSTAGVNFSIGGLISSVVSNPPGSRPCERGGSCGIPGLIAVAQATQGSADNASEVGRGRLDSAIIQADVAAQAYEGKGAFAGANRQADLRALTSLYPETLQIVVRRDAKVKTLAGLKGKRVSIDTAGSGTQMLARNVLARAGLRPADFKPSMVDLGAGVDMMRNDQLDALFYVGGVPAPAIAQLADMVPIDLLPLPPAVLAALRKEEPAYLAMTVLAGSYAGVTTDIASMGIYSLWVANSKLSDDMAYNLLKALWHKSAQPMLANGHPAGRQMALASALNGLTIPLHAGAARFYTDMKLLKSAAPPAKP